MSSRLYYIITITNRVMGSKHFLDFYRAFGAPVVFSALGRGTASDDMLSYLGLEATEKTVLFSVVAPQVKDVLMRELVDTMHIDRPGSGIAVCLHLSSVGGQSAMNYLTSGGADAQPDLSVKEEDLMHESGYELVIAIANGGYSDMVMEAASAAGAPSAAEAATKPRPARPAAAGKPAAKKAPAKPANKKKSTSDAAAHAVGKELGKMGSMFGSFMDEYKKASK